MYRLIILALLASACASATPTASPTPAPTPVYAHLKFDIIDEATGEPVTAQVSIRREKLDGTLVDEYPTYTDQHVDVEVPIDPEVKVFILVEADGYHDWEVALRIKQRGTLSGPIRLKRTSPSDATHTWPGSLDLESKSEIRTPSVIARASVSNLKVAWVWDNSSHAVSLLLRLRRTYRSTARNSVYQPMREIDAR